MPQPSVKESTMKTSTVVFSLVAAALLPGCGWSRAVAQDEHDHQHQSASAGSAEKSPHAGMMDMKAMCDMHRQMMSKGTAADRDAMADTEMKGMSAEQKQQHMKMMDEQCK
jgi:hypothetical protein